MHELTVEERALKRLMRLKSLAAQFGHAWAHIDDDTFIRLYYLFVVQTHTAWGFPRRWEAFRNAINNLAFLNSHPSLPGGRTLPQFDERLEYFFGSHDQLKVVLSTSLYTSVSYTNSRGEVTQLTYFPVEERYDWLKFPAQQRDAARVVAVCEFFTGIPIDFGQTAYVDWNGEKKYFTPDGKEFTQYINYFRKGMMGAFMAAPFEE